MSGIVIQIDCSPVLVHLKVGWCFNYIVFPLNTFYRFSLLNKSRAKYVDFCVHVSVRAACLLVHSGGNSERTLIGVWGDRLNLYYCVINHSYSRRGRRSLQYILTGSCHVDIFHISSQSISAMYRFNQLLNFFFV